MNARILLKVFFLLLPSRHPYARPVARMLWGAEMAQIREWMSHIPDEDLRCYAQQLYRSFPGKVCDVYDNSQSMDVFHRRLGEKQHDKCMFCLANGALDNVALDSAVISAMDGCDHRGCVQCWRVYYKRQKAWFEHAECPTCRQDVAGFLKKEYAWKDTE
jgi:hypothetical protein